MSSRAPKLILNGFTSASATAFLAAVIILLTHSSASSKDAVTCISRTFEESSTVAPLEVEEAAQKGLQRFLNAIPQKDFRHFNFSSRDEFKDAKVGRAFRVFTIQADEVLNCGTDSPLLGLVHPTPMWFFPVISQGDYRTTLTVDLMDTQWRAVGIGNSDLAKSFASILTKWPPSQGYHYVFVRNYQTLSEFVILIRFGTEKVIPLPTAINSWGIKEEKILEPFEVLILLQNSLGKHGLH